MCDIIGCDEAAEYRDSDNLYFCGCCMAVNMQKTGKRNSGYERIEEEGVPETKNCLNCRWQPEWVSEFIDGHEKKRGRCRFPNLPCFATLHSVFYYTGHLLPGLNCPAWEAKKQEAI